MATVNLGRIKPVFRGAYSGSTAYVVDDIVTHGNESFICIQAHGAGTQATSQGSYWTKLAAKGTDGTDVGTTITTQGDILYRDGSGLQRLAKGTAGQILQMNSGANAPEWTVKPEGGLVQTAFGYKTDVFSSTTTGSWNDVTGIAISLSSVGANSHKAIGNFGFAWGTATEDTVSNFRIRKTIDGGSNWAVLTNHEHGSSSGGAATFRGQTMGLRSLLDDNGGNYTNLPFYDSAIGTTGTVTYQLQQRRTQAGTFYINRTANDATEYGRGSSNFWVMEVKV